MAPQDMYGGLACKLEATPSSIWMFDVQRGRRQAAFDDNDAKLLRHLVPHFSPGSTDQPGSGIDDDGCFGVFTSVIRHCSR